MPAPRSQRSLVPQQMLPSRATPSRFVTAPVTKWAGDWRGLISLPDGVQGMAVRRMWPGKGLASAIVSTAFRSAFRASVGRGLPLASSSRGSIASIAPKETKHAIATWTASF